MAPSAEQEKLLSPDHYDDDASSLHSSSSSASATAEPPRLSSDTVADEDYGILAEEQEHEELLQGGRRTQSGVERLFGSTRNPHEPVGVGKSDKSRKKRESKRRNRRKGRRGGDGGDLVYEMEEGGQGSQSTSSAASLMESDLGKEAIGAEKLTQPLRRHRRVWIHVSIAVLFAVLLVGALHASTDSSSKPLVQVLSNGTSKFAPTTLLLSLDGFRADFLYRDLTPTLNSFIANGVSPKYMLPSFPSLTFPNHYTLVTGLYPECHGIVGNSFWDPNMNKEFYYTDPTKSMQPEWWGGEPIWVTAENEGVRAAVHMWPGSEAHIGGVGITHIDKYNGLEKLSVKVDRILSFLDLPGPEDPSASVQEARPQLIAAYVPVVDSDGHKYGPNSTEIRQTISDVDNMLNDILTGLDERNLADVVNIVVVSDHGMATTSVDRLIQLEDLIDTDLIEHTDGWPLYGLRPKKHKDIKSIYHTLQKHAKTNPGFEVYLRDKDMPERYHFSNNDRIAPIWIVPETGWAIVTKDDFDVQKALKNGDIYHPRGLHGYDHEHPLMRAIFVARGPAFPHTPGSRVDIFQNFEVYNIICDSIGIEPRPNNGTLRLPLKPVGLHSDVDGPPSDTPDDPPTSENGGHAAVSATRPEIKKPTQNAEQTGAEASHGTSESEPSKHHGGYGNHKGSSGQGKPKGKGKGKTGGKPTDDGTTDEEDSKPLTWWEWVKEKIGSAKTWSTNWFKVGEDASEEDHSGKAT